MESSTGNVKQKKPSVMYVYRLDTGNLKPPPESNPSSKKATSRGLGMGSLRRSKTIREVDHRRMNKVVEDIAESRKSVSSEVAAASKSVSDLEYDRRRIMMNKVVEDKEIHHVEAKKSVSSSEAAAARKSVSHVEVNNAAAVAAFLQVKVLVSDMPAFMQVHAFRCARRTYDSLEKFSSKHMAYNLKKEFDKVYGPAWHCIVGSSFGSFVTHSTGGFLYFSMEKLYILVFKTKVQRALDP